MIKEILVISLILLSVSECYPQDDSLLLDKRSKDRYGIWLIPSASKNIYGIAVGPFGSETVCNRPYTKYSHGLNLQIPGQGFFQTFYINKIRFSAGEDSDSSLIQDTLPKRAVHNGLLISPLGTFTDQVNGVSMSLWMSMGKRINGLSFNLLWNCYHQINGLTIGAVNSTAMTNGLQIGLVNSTLELRGFQIGLWNRNEKRSLPIINWSFGNGEIAPFGKQSSPDLRTDPVDEEF